MSKVLSWLGDFWLLLCLVMVSNFSACIVYEQGKKEKQKLWCRAASILKDSYIIRKDMRSPWKGRWTRVMVGVDWKPVASSA